MGAWGPVLLTALPAKLPKRMHKDAQRLNTRQLSFLACSTFFLALRPSSLACVYLCRHVLTCSSNPSSDSPGSDDASTPSTSYSLPWETEQPAPPPNYATIQANIGHMDTNQLQTALGVAIAAEDYQLAAQ